MTTNPTDLAQMGVIQFARALSLATLASAAVSVSLSLVAVPISDLMLAFTALKLVTTALYACLVAMFFGVPAYLLLRNRRGLPRWLSPLAGAAMFVLPIVIVDALMGSVSSFVFWVAGVSGAVGGFVYWTLVATTLRTKVRLRFASSALVAAGLIGPTLWVAVWRVEVPQALSQRDSWENASPNECPLMAEALDVVSRTRLPQHPSLPLAGRSNGGGPCDWPGRGRLAYDEFKNATGGSGSGDAFLGYMIVSRPHYSALRLRAAIDVGIVEGQLGGHGYVCNFHRGLGGWRLDDCGAAWIA